jgi:AcrR family transcriptional regulator
MTTSRTRATAAVDVASLRTVPQQARGRDKVVRMLEAADRLMATEGADAITTTRVAAEAGISVGSVYRYLPNREAIIEGLAVHYLSLLEARLDELISDLASGAWAPDDIVGESIDAFADFYRTHPGFRALWFGRHLTADTMELDRAHKLRMAERGRTLLVARGIGKADRATLRVAQVLQLSQDAVIQEAFRLDPRGDKQLLNQLKVQTRSFVAALAAETGS